ncbi:redoxin family protein [Larkinella bovis]|uniref:Redoxin family protein n=1 Tax=Larkinella bovis TaxID=683041 RepID=A0ABW0I2V1_9BACT
MFRLLFFFALLAGIAYGQKPVTRYTITGHLKNLKNGQTIYLIPRAELFVPKSSPRAPQIDSCVASEGRFTLEGMLGEPNYYALGIKGQPHARFRSFILDGPLISIIGDADSLERASIVGSTSLRDQVILAKSVEVYLKQQKILESLLRNAEQKADKDSLFVLNNQYQKLSNGILDVKATFIGFNPRSYVSLFALQEMLPELPKERARYLFNHLDYSLQQHSVGRQIREQVFERVKPVRQYAPDLVLADKNAKPVHLQAYKGSVLLIDFWASWCSHCQREQKRLKTLYKQYKSKGLEIVSISVDEDPKAWKKALQKAGLPWPQLSDRVDDQNAVGTHYGNNSIPMNLLIDKEGFVIRKGLHGAELEKQLAVVFSNP